MLMAANGRRRELRMGGGNSTGTRAEGLERLLARTRAAVCERREGQVLARHAARASGAPCVVVAQRRGGWRVDGAAGVSLPQVATPAPSSDGELDAWLAARTARNDWRAHDLKHGRRRVARLFAVRLTPQVLAACRAVEPYFAALDVPRARTEPTPIDLATLAHDLRQPLTSLRLWLSLVNERAPEQPPAEVLDRCLGIISRMDALIADVLAIDGGPRMFESDLDLAALVAAVAEEQRPVAAARDVRIAVERTAQPRLRGNRPSLMRALSNVIHNAIVHGPANGEVGVRVGVTAGVAFVEVRDGGPGVPPLLRERVFEPRFSSSGGNGLGLAVTRAVAQAHGGRAFFVDGTASGPCRLRLELPLVVDSPRALLAT
jgi:signal transduction histidine kinase